MHCKGLNIEYKIFIKKLEHNSLSCQIRPVVPIPSEAMAEWLGQKCCFPIVDNNGNL